MINSILRRFNLRLVKYFPRHSVNFAKQLFFNKPIVAVEIGTYKGENALSILTELNIEKIYLIDPYNNYSEYKDINDAENEARKRLQKYNHKIKWVKMFSDDAIKFIKDKLDFVYIDGNHSYNIVKEDINNYYQLLDKGGILAGHDITSYSGVVQAVIEFCSENKINPYFSETDWWIIKNKEV